MVSHDRVLIVLERAPRVFLVHDALIRKLLVIVADLNDYIAWIVNFLVCNDQLAERIDVWRVLIGPKPHFKTAYTRLFEAGCVYSYF